MVGESPQRTSQFALPLLVTVAIMIGATAGAFYLRGVPLAVIEPTLYDMGGTAAILLAVIVVVLAWIRFVETGQTGSLLLAAAFLALLAGDAIAFLSPIGSQAADRAFNADAPSQAPIYLWTVQCMFAAGLLLLGAVAARRGWHRRSSWRAPVVALMPATLVTAIGVFVIGAANALPIIVEPGVLGRLTTTLDLLDPSLLSPALLITQLAIGAVFTFAAWLCYDGQAKGAYPPYGGVFAVGFLVAAFAQVHYAVAPGAYTDVITSGTGLRLTFYAIVAIGAAVAVQQDLVALRRANKTLRELRAADAQRVVLQERARLAREIHDGLVQELWHSRLTVGQLRRLPDLPPEASAITQRIDASLENALGEARQAVVTLQPQVVDASFESLLTQFVDDYSDHFGLEVECIIDSGPVLVSRHAQAELLRICREALTNVRKHADAATAKVRLESDETTIRLTIADNGSGFDLNERGNAGFGLRSMRERASGLGGRVHIDSEPMDGTRVIVELAQEIVAADVHASEASTTPAQASK